MGRRLPARALIGSAAVAVGAVVLAWLLLRGMEQSRAELGGLLATLALLSVVWLGIAHLAAALRLGGSLRRHYAAGALAAAGIVVAAVMACASLMLVSREVVEVLLAIVAASTIVAVRVAGVVADGAAATLDELGRGLEQLADEDAEQPHLAEGGPREIASVARSANRMATDLGRAREERRAADLARRELVAAASHDLRTPLAALRLLGDAVADGVVTAPEEVADYQRQARTHLRHLEALVEDLFELARIDAGDVAWLVEPVLVAAIADEAVDAFRASAASRGIALTAEIAPDLPTVSGSPEKLQRVLFNLIDNAVRHTPDGGAVVVRARAAAGGVEVQVDDTGPGVPEGDRERVFVRFHRGGAEGAARTGDGAGLGLAIARSIVEQHDGRISVEDGPSGGARFRVLLPAGGDRRA